MSKDLRRARTAAANLVPTSTGAAFRERADAGPLAERVLAPAGVRA